MSDKLEGVVKVNRCGWKQTLFEDVDGLLPRLYSDDLFEDKINMHGEPNPVFSEAKRILIYRYKGSYRGYDKFLRFDGERVKISGRLGGLPYYNESSKCYYQDIFYVRQKGVPQGLLFDIRT